MNEAFLLDTHTFIWFATGDVQISELAKSKIDDPAVRVHLSTVSVWEMAIKSSIGKLSLKKPLQELVQEQIILNKYHVLDVGLAHAFQIQSLPFFHKDPFDRTLIAQAMIEGLPILGKDAIFDAYEVTRVW